MQDPNERMIAKQAEIISSLRTKIDKLEVRLEEERIRADSSYQRAEFYRIIEDSLKDNESLQNAWDSFVVMLRLIHPDLDQQFKNVRLRKAYSPWQ